MIRKIIKAFKIIVCRAGAYEMFRYGTAASVEHIKVLSEITVCSVVDVGANRGQFALIARKCYPDARIDSFEPLRELVDRIEVMFAKDKNVYIHCLAIGVHEGEVRIHVSKQDDSSSLLPIGKAQTTLFPGTGEREQRMVRISPLDVVLKMGDIQSPALLKLDVQGFELEALRGCESLLNQFHYVYCECSFVELYEGQALADEVIDFLYSRGFKLAGIYNMTYDRKGRAIQADMMFHRGGGNGKI